MRRIEMSSMLGKSDYNIIKHYKTYLFFFLDLGQKTKLYRKCDIHTYSP